MRELDSRSIDYKYIHTGQHYDHILFQNFIEEFRIRQPDIAIEADISNPVSQVATIMNEISVVINKIRSSIVLTEADTNSVLASALSALKSNFPIGHVESGLRSYDWKTVEEHNRKIVDHVSDTLFSPTNISTQNLKDENVHGQIYTVGYTVIDAINLCFAREKHNLNSVTSTDSHRDGKQRDDFVLVTMHRSENVDDIAILKKVLVTLTESTVPFFF